MQNGCELPPLVGLTNFKLSVNSKHLDLEVKQGSNITPCIQKLKLQNFGKSAFFGLTASNPPDKAASSIDLHRLQFWNMSPQHYRKEEAKPQEESSQDQASDDLIAQRQAMLQDKETYFKNNLLALSLQDSPEETMYKMYESQKHVNTRI